MLEVSAITSALALVGLAVLSWRIHRAFSDRARLQVLGQENHAVNEEPQPVATTGHEQIVGTGSSTNHGLEQGRDVAAAEDHRFRAEQQASWASETYARIFAESWEERGVIHLVGETLHDYSYVYTLPFSAGFGYRVIQGPCGSFSHEGKDATDFAMPVGTPVCSSRNGEVVTVVEIHRENGPLGTPCNMIRILHEDGSVAEYSHLVQGGALVHVGDRVVAGACIGFSGNTGYSTEPHLHLEVIPEPAGTRPAAIRFNTADATGPTLLVAGFIYRRPWFDDQGVAHRAPFNAFDSCTLIDGAGGHPGRAVFLQVDEGPNPRPFRCSLFSGYPPGRREIGPPWRSALGLWFPLPENAMVGQWSVVVYFEDEPIWQSSEGR